MLRDGRMTGSTKLRRSARLRSERQQRAGRVIVSCLRGRAFCRSAASGLLETFKNDAASRF